MRNFHLLYCPGMRLSDFRSIICQVGQITSKCGKNKHMECFHMISRQPYWCLTTMKRWPYPNQYKLFFYVNTFFCSNKFAWQLVTWVNAPLPVQWPIILSRKTMMPHWLRARSFNNKSFLTSIKIIHHLTHVHTNIGKSYAFYIEICEQWTAETM